MVRTLTMCDSGTGPIAAAGVIGAARAAVLAFALCLAACGTDQPAPVEEESPPVAEGQAMDPVEADAPQQDAEDDPDTPLEIVEESASEASDSGEEALRLARVEPKAPKVSYKYREGQHYQRLVPSQPTIGGADKIEVAEFFWYGCPHCYDLEPTINRWAANKPSNVRFVRVPAMWNDVLETHAKLFYAEEVLVRNGVIKDGEGFHKAVFDEYHERNNRLLTEQSIRRLFARFGVSDEQFDKAWNSFEVAQKLRVAADLARRYSIAAVPAIVVNGKYRTGGSEAGGYPQLIEVIDELVARESTR